MKSSTFEDFKTKSLQSRNSHVGLLNSIRGRPKLDMPDLTDSNVDLFIYLTEEIRFGT